MMARKEGEEILEAMKEKGYLPAMGYAAEKISISWKLTTIFTGGR
jgi:hypothetical protein